jgi:hypothetical protein
VYLDNLGEAAVVGETIRNMPFIKKVSCPPRRRDEGDRSQEMLIRTRAPPRHGALHTLCFLVSGRFTVTYKPSFPSYQVIWGGGLLDKWKAMNVPNLEFVDKLIAQRKADMARGEAPGNDLLSLMLTKQDPRYGDRA